MKEQLIRAYNKNTISVSAQHKSPVAAACVRPVIFLLKLCRRLAHLPDRHHLALASSVSVPERTFVVRPATSTDWPPDPSDAVCRRRRAAHGRRRRMSVSVPSTRWRRAGVGAEPPTPPAPLSPPPPAPTQPARRRPFDTAHRAGGRHPAIRSRPTSRPSGPDHTARPPYGQTDRRLPVPEQNRSAQTQPKRRSWTHRAVDTTSDAFKKL